MKDKKAQVFHFDLYGKREDKYDFLNDNSLQSIVWTELKPEEPNFFFVNKNFTGQKEYENGFKVDELFMINNSGLATEFDDLSIKETKKEAELLLKNLQTLNANEILNRYALDLRKKTKVENAINDVSRNTPKVTIIDYRPFDHRFTIYTGVSNGIMGRPRNGVMQHMLKDNLALLTCRQQTSFDFQHVFITKSISERYSVSLQTGEVNYIFPLYLYPESPLGAETERVPNLNMEIVERIGAKIFLYFYPEEPDYNSNDTVETNQFYPKDILDYIYAVLHSPTYRETYKEFLKIDFPRVPYPNDQDTFWQLVNLGGELRHIHLLESPKVEKYITQYPIAGDNVVGKLKYENGKVFINETQYFDNVPQVAWEFYIGGYQPAQKWLKDRKDRTLGFEDILHYQKIIVALTETDRLMKEIDKIEIER